MKTPIVCYLELCTLKDLDLQKKQANLPFFDLENLTFMHSQLNIGQHIDLKSKLNQNLESFAHKQKTKMISIVILWP